MKNSFACSLSEANNLFRSGRYEKAISMYLEVIRETPELGKALTLNISLARARINSDAAMLSPLEEYVTLQSLSDLLEEKLSVAKRSAIMSHRLAVVANICTIPARFDLLPQTIESIYSQVDIIHLYMDCQERIPFALQQYSEKLVITSAKHFPELKDNGKLLSLVALKSLAYYFMMDDDILYPSDYVAQCIRKIEEYGCRAVIGVHGITLPTLPNRYFHADRKVIHFSNECDFDTPVNLLGTGTASFCSSLLSDLDLKEFSNPGMLDVHLGIFCKKNSIPMVAVARKRKWLIEIPNDSPSLFNKYKNNDSIQTQLVLNAAPWRVLRAR